MCAAAASESAGTGATTSDTGSNSFRSGECHSEQEYVLSELETSDSGSIGVVLRVIYDGGDVGKFVRSLERKIGNYDREIEKLCSFHYHSFVESVQELLELKTQCNELKTDIATIDRFLRDNSKVMLRRAEQILAERKLQRNIASAVDAVSLCLPALEKYSKLVEQMDSKKYYPALKTLEQLEHTYLPRIERYRFAEKMLENIGTIRQKIKEASFSEFTDFLENIRKVSAKIGEIALRHTAEQQQFSTAGVTRARRIQLFSPSKSKGISGESMDIDDDEFSAQDMVDFSPVYRCCHIFTILNAKDTFETYYRTKRSEQASLLLKGPETMFGSLQSFRNYINEVIGFFVVEDHIMQTASDLVTRSYRDELWEIAVGHMEKALNDHFGKCTEDETMLAVKKLILIFVHTMKGYGFQVSRLYRVLQNFRDQYNEILMSRCCARFDELLVTDNYTPIVVTNQDDLRCLEERFPLARKIEEIEDGRGVVVDSTDYAGDGNFPRTFPFSELAPSVYEHVKEFIRNCMKFVDNLGMSQTDIDENIRRTTNLLLERFSGHLKRYLIDELKTTSLAQLVQVTINMGYLGKSCELLDLYIGKVTGLGGSGGYVVRLKEDMFKDARSEVEQKIDDAVRLKVDEVLSLAQYRWDIGSCDGRPSGYITDLIHFLQTTFISFTNLPVLLARHICVQLCKYIASRLLMFLTDPDVRQISSGALEQINLDVVQCEQFAAQCPVPGFEDGTLVLTFADMRQLLDLFMSSDWSTYLADFGKEDGRYIRVHPTTAICVLEKVYEHERRKGTLFGKAKDKDRKKLLDTILRQLKSYVNAPGVS